MNLSLTVYGAGPWDSRYDQGKPPRSLLACQGLSRKPRIAKAIVGQMGSQK